MFEFIEADEVAQNHALAILNSANDQAIDDLCGIAQGSASYTAYQPDFSLKSLYQFFLKGF